MSRTIGEWMCFIWYLTGGFEMRLDLTKIAFVPSLCLRHSFLCPRVRVCVLVAGGVDEDERRLVSLPQRLHGEPLHLTGGGGGVVNSINSTNISENV